MEKKYIVIVLVVLTAWISLMGYRHFLTTQETREHYQEAYDRMEVIALKTPSGGLAQMAMALNKYRQENKQYPAHLMDLHPRYVISQTFLTRIDWDYKPASDNFYLSKTITVNGRKLSAAIDKNLRPSMDSRIMLAGTTPTTAPPVIASLPAAPEDPQKTAIPDTVSPKQAVPAALPETAVETYIDTGPASPVAAALSSRYLVWKDKNGHLGFGNINYPNDKEIFICDVDKWLTLAKPDTPPNRETQSSEMITAMAESPTAAMAQNTRFLVWKNKQGVIGFGNVDYPNSDQVSLIYADGEWQKINGGSHVRQ